MATSKVVGMPLYLFVVRLPVVGLVRLVVRISLALILSILSDVLFVVECVLMDTRLQLITDSAY